MNTNKMRKRWCAFLMYLAMFMMVGTIVLTWMGQYPDWWVPMISILSCGTSALLMAVTLDNINTREESKQ